MIMMSVKLFIKCILSFKGIVSDSGERLLILEVNTKTNTPPPPPPHWIMIADYTFKFHIVFMYILKALLLYIYTNL